MFKMSCLPLVDFSFQYLMTFLLFSFHCIVLRGHLLEKTLNMDVFILKCINQLKLLLFFFRSLLLYRRPPRRCSPSFWVASSLRSTPSTPRSEARDISWLLVCVSSSLLASSCYSLPSLACTTWVCRSASPSSVSFTRR